MKKQPERFIQRFGTADVRFPDCGTCIHAPDDMRTCPAYPNGIPEELCMGYATHRTVRPDQQGTTIYTKRS